MTPPTDLRRLHACFRSRRLSPLEHVTDVLERLRTDQHNAVVALDEERALADAAALTEELHREGPRSDLHGVAVGVKDLIDVAGLPTRGGSRVLAAAPPAAADADVVARLREAGAVVVAKLHTHEFGYGPTGDVAATGPALNPCDRTRITGGSSSGPAAAVAAGHLPLALGTDTGGSVRIPAALCGVVGLKPRFGALPTRGVLRLAESLDHVGLLGADPWTVAAGWEALRPDPATRPRRPLPRADVVVGVPHGTYWRAAAPVAAAVEAAAEELRRKGARLVLVSTPAIDELAGTYMPILGAEAYATHAAWLAERPDAYDPRTAGSLALLADQPAHDYVAARRERRRLTDALRERIAEAGAASGTRVDALLLPTTRLQATPLGTRFAEVESEAVTVEQALLELTLPFNLTGWPALSVPAPGPALPVGVQLVGLRLDEAGLLELADADH